MSSNAALDIVIRAQDNAQHVLRQIGQDFDDVSEKAGHAQRAGSSFFSNMLSSAAGFMSAHIFEQIGGGILDAARGMIDYNANLEQYQVTLTTVLGSQQEAVEMMDWARKFAAQTPFEIPGIVEATTRLQAYGLSAKELLPDIGDMAAVMGKPLMQAVEAIADAQTGELERLKEFGITKKMIVDQSNKMMLGEVVNAQGQITNLDNFNKALFDLMQERYQGGMEAQSKTFRGMLSNVNDFIGTLGGKIGAPVFEKLGGILKGALEWLTKPEVAAAIDNVANVIGEGLGGALDLAGRGFGLLIDVGKYLIGWFGDIRDGWDAAGLGGALSAFFDMLKDAGGKIVSGLGDLGGALIERLRGVGWGNVATTLWSGFTGALLAYAGFLADFYGAIWKAVSGIDWGAVWRGAGEMAGALTGWLGEQWGKIDWGLVFASVGTGLASLWTIVSTWVRDRARDWGPILGEWAGAIGAWIAQRATDLPGNLAAWWSAITTWVRDRAGDWGPVLADWAGAVWNWITTTAGAIPGWLAAWWTTVSTWVSDRAKDWAPTLESWIDAFDAWVLSKADQADDKLAAWWDSIKGWISAKTAEWPTSLEEWWTAISSWIGSVPGKITDALSAWGSAVTGWISGFFSTGEAQDSLGAAASGFTSGLSAKLEERKPDMIDKVSKLLKDLLYVAGVIALVTAGEVGKDIAHSLVFGIGEGFIGFGKWLGDLIKEELSQIDITIGPFHLNKDGFKIDAPSWLGGGGGGLRTIAGAIGQLVPGGLGAYPMTTGFGEFSLGRYHTWGEDYGVPMGTPITAPTDVSVTGGWMGDWGNQLNMILSNGAQIIVSHLSGFADTIRDGIASAGEVLGWSGSTGFSTGAHIDLQTILANGMRVAPSQFFGIPGSRGGGGQGGGGQDIGALLDQFGAITEKVGPAIETLQRLRDFVGPSKEAVQAFGQGVADVVSEMGKVAGYFKIELVQVTAQFSESAGTILENVGKGIGPLLALKDFESPPKSAIESFGQSMFEVITKMGQVAGWFQIELVEATATFADAAGRIVGVIGTGVQAFTALQDYKGVPSAVLDQFMLDLQAAVTKMVAISGTIDKDMLPQANLFATTAGNIFTAMKGGIDVFAGLVDYKGIPAYILDLFFNDLQAAVAKMTAIAAVADTEMTKKAGEFATSIGSVFSTMKTALDTFSGLKDYETVPPDRIQGIFDNMVTMLGKMADLRGKAEDFKNLAGEFKGFVDNGVSDLTNALNSLPGVIAAAQAVLNGGTSTPSGEYGPGWTVPVLDNGAIVTRPTLALLAANGEPEGVYPLKGRGSGNITININHPTIREEQDIRKLAQEIKREFSREMRLQGAG